MNHPRRRPSGQPSSSSWTVVDLPVVHLVLSVVCFLSCVSVGHSFSPKIDLQRSWIPLELRADPSAGDTTTTTTTTSSLLTAADRNQQDDETAAQDIVVAEQIALGKRRLQPYFDFPLDDWQLQAGGAICQGHNVIVCAPTGAGKTVVGEMALLNTYYHSDRGASASATGIYTTPLKALSNQKYSELCQTFGRAETGLSTGDISINKGARITVMTTEVYRNIAWRSSTPTSIFVEENKNTNDELSQNAVVVLDEFHYMGHPGRGGVWEESIIMSPAKQTQIVGLSATLSNGPDLAAWMETVTERTTVLVNVPAFCRPVPLRYLFATKEGLFSLFRDPDAGPGSPKGLLGYRGDGTVTPPLASKNNMTFTRTGFGQAAERASERLDNPNNNQKFPRGLQVNPALKAAAEKLNQRVQRSLEKQKVQWRVGSNTSGGRGRNNKNDDKNNDDDEQEFLSKFAAPSRPKRRLSPREERKEKERLLRKEMRRAVPALHALVNRLNQKDLLPAIFFLFSRAGCDQAAKTLHQYMKGPDTTGLTGDDNNDNDNDDNNAEWRRAQQQQQRDENKKKRRKTFQTKNEETTNSRGQLLEDQKGRTFRKGSNFVSEEALSSMYNARLLEESDFDQESSPLSPRNWDYYSKAGLLNYEQIRKVASRIAAFNQDNNEIAFDDEIIEQYLFGVGSHHAGKYRCATEVSSA
jgi:hypothetical protein